MPRFRFHGHSPRLLAMLVAGLAACSPEPAPDAPAQSPALLDPAELALARHHQGQQRPDLAVAILAKDPTHPDVRALLADHQWHLPSLRLDHPGCEVRHVLLQNSSLWVGLSLTSFHTVVRWNLETLAIEAVLLPSRDPLRAMVLSPNAKHLVVARGGVALLVDAESLQPIADLGNLPADLTPESSIVFRPDSLLVAHADAAGWHIRDTGSGQILRSLAKEELPPAPVLAAHLDTQRLRLLANDGSRIDVPVSPAEPFVVTPFEEEKIEILHAHIVPHGEAALVALNLGPHTTPAVVEMGFSELAPTEPFDLDGWATLQPQSTLPGLANGLFRHLAPPPVVLADGLLEFHGKSRVPVPTEGTPIAYAADALSNSFAVVENPGTLTLHRRVEIPTELTPDALTALAGFRYDPVSAELEAVDLQARHEALTQGGLKSAASDALLPLWQRLSDSLPENSPELSALPLLSLTPSPVDHGLAHRLADALANEDPVAIRLILQSATTLPPTLKTLVQARLKQLDGDTAAAFQPYHEKFPDLTTARLREDWRGWERADFLPCMTAIESAYRALIDTLTIPANADETARREIIARLTAPESLAALGRSRHAIACLDAAHALADVPEETEAVFTLASLARHHGAPAVPCLRAEALALTTLESYRDAHARWIELITEHPVEEHLPADYSEAAYTAFENDDARQAIEILVTGMARFEKNADFAIRAGWIALLAGEAEHAGAFLVRGKAVGFPEDQAEKATAMLAAAAVLVHDSVAATAYFQDLLAINPAWGEPETLDTLDWPDHLVAALRQLVW